MQNVFQQTLKSIKARAGRGESQENFKLGTGAVLVPKNIETPTVNANLNLNSLLNNTSKPSILSSKTFNVPKFANQFTNSSQRRWVNLAFILTEYKHSKLTNHQLIEPLNSQARGVFGHTPSMRDFGEISIFISRQTVVNNPTDADSLQREIDFIDKILSQTKVRLKHPIFGYINGTATSIEINRNTISSCIITFSFKEIQADLDEVIPQTPPILKKTSFFSKIKNTIGTIRDYTFATISEFNSVVSKIDKLSGSLYNASQTLNSLQSNVLGTLEPFNRLAHSIGTLTTSGRDLLRFPDKLGNKLEQIGNNFSNINLSLTPSRPNSRESIKKNNSNKQVVRSLLSSDKFALDNSDLLSTTNEESKASYEALAVSQQSYVLGLALFATDDIDFNTTQEIDDIEKTIGTVASALIEFQLYLGTDVYGNKVYHRIEFLTQEIIELILEVSSLYNDFLLRMQQLKQVLGGRRSTVIKKPINMINLVRILYNGEYNPQDVEEEQELINQICYLNKIDNFWFISGKIFY